MKQLLTFRDSDIFIDNVYSDVSDYRNRKAARAVVLDETGAVALLKANTYNYHKLPGGGVEEGEDMKLALKRELMEEIGCKAKIKSEVGEIVEYRNQWQLKQISHCYLATKTGKQRDVNFTESEIYEGFEVIWVDNMDMAIDLLEKDSPTNYDGKFIQQRDIFFLRTAKTIAEKSE